MSYGYYDPKLGFVHICTVCKGRIPEDQPTHKCVSCIHKSGRR